MEVAGGSAAPSLWSAAKVIVKVSPDSCGQTGRTSISSHEVSFLFKGATAQLEVSLFLSSGRKRDDMRCFPFWLREGSEKFLKCIWRGRRDVTLINSKLEKAGKTSQLQREM